MIRYYLKKHSLLLSGVLITSIIILLGVFEKNNIEKNKIICEAIVFDVFETRRNIKIEFKFIYKGKEFVGILSDYGTKYAIGDTCLIAVDSTDPQCNYFVSLKNKR